MRRVIIPLVSIVVFFALAGCQDNRVPPLEKRITELETKVKNLEDLQEARANADSIKETDFKQCVYRADDEFDHALRMNGSKNSDGSYAVPTSTLQQIQRQKESKLEECKLLYK
jgi:hypothetical protein